MASSCPACGAAASGKFCATCGAALEAQPCGRCGRANAPGAKFCAGCGSGLGAGVAAAPGVARGGSVLPLVIAGVAVIAAVMVFVLKSQPAAPTAPAAPFANGGGGTPPDLSQMTPREAFLRLHDRVMAAMEQGDTATVNQFSPMALMAYQQLPEVDPEVQYHVASLRLHTGDLAGATVLADSIQATHARHLFGYILRAQLAQFGGRPDEAVGQYKAYLAALDDELKAGRPEYAEHQAMLDRITQTARTRTSGQ